MAPFLDLPGNWVAGEDRGAAGDAYLLLSQVVDAFNEAIVAQRAFEELNEPFIRGARGRLDVPRIDQVKRLIFAKAFVFALDELRQFVNLVGSTLDGDQQVAARCSKFVSKYELVRRIRNSLHHVEDRVRGLGPGGSRLSATLLALRVTVDRRFGVTTTHNCIEYLPVTREYFEDMRMQILEVIWGYPWLGPGDVPVTRD